MGTKNRRVNSLGQVILSNQQLCNLILQGKNINNVVVEDSDDYQKYLKYKNEILDKTHELSLESNQQLEDFHIAHSNTWLFPKEYQQIDVLKWLLSKCSNQQQIDRVKLEFQIYQERQLVMLLRFFIYLVDYFRKNNYIWGVGRGSSVASYILFIIGIHRVDSIKYNLPISEYLK